MENSTLSAAKKRETAREHIELVGLSAFRDGYPHQLSGGMTQRTAIASGLVNRPRLLLLDEPFGALDALAKAHLQDEPHRIWQADGIAMILVAHGVEKAVYLGDRVVELAHPRDRNSTAVQDLRSQVLDDLHPKTLPIDSTA